MGESHIFDLFDGGEATHLVEEKLFSLDPATMAENYEDDTLLLTQGVVELNERKVFLEGVATYLGKNPHTKAEELFEEVKKRYAEKGIELKKAVKGWFQKEDVSPSTDQAYRRNLYDFCVAMGMDYQATAAFFLKAFLTIPFNYKDRDDAIYFYCLKEGRPYSVIKQMLDVADSYAVTNADVAFTEEIGLRILEIQSDDEFLEYLQRYCYDRKHQYSTAKEKIRFLVADNKKKMPEETYEKIGSDQKSPKKVRKKRNTETAFSKNPEASKNKELLNAILGYCYQELDDEQRSAIRECGLPVFPTDGDIGKVIASDKEVSFEVLRKSLILMNFYNYFRHKQIAKKQKSFMDIDDIQEHLWEFYEETNQLLAECGFVQMYLRNPFDWIILFCANSPNPIDCLKDFILKRYLESLE